MSSIWHSCSFSFSFSFSLTPVLHRIDSRSDSPVRSSRLFFFAIDIGQEKPWLYSNQRAKSTDSLRCHVIEEKFLIEYSSFSWLHLDQCTSFLVDWRWTSSLILFSSPTRIWAWLFQQQYNKIHTVSLQKTWNKTDNSILFNPSSRIQIQTLWWIRLYLRLVPAIVVNQMKLRIIWWIV